MPAPVQGTEGVQLGRPRPGEQAVPGARSDTGHHGQATLGGPERDGPDQPGQIAEQVADGRLAAVVNGEDEEDGAGRQRGEHRLGKRRPRD